METKKIYCNLKLNFTVADFSVYLHEVNSLLKLTEISTDGLAKHKNTFSLTEQLIILAPPYFWPALSEYPVIWGAQNIGPQAFGAYTGEVSLRVLEEMGGRYTILGHSERRHIFFEHDDLLYAKLILLLQSKVCPIFCIGERANEMDHFDEILRRQLQVLRKIETHSKLPLVIAYEPVWAIGTGLTAKNHQIIERIQWIKKELVAYTCIELKEVLYGGSVNSQNLEDILKISDVDGVLVGGASLKTDFIREALQILVKSSK